MDKHIFSIKALFILFVVASCNKSGNSNINTIPLPPVELSGIVISTTQINLAWVDKSTNETGFKIERKTSATQFTVIAAVGSDVTSFSDNSVIPSTTYIYRVYSFNSIGSSLTYTNEVTLTTVALPSLTTNVISNINANDAVSGGNITSDGGSNIISRGVVWSTSTNPTISLSSKTIDGFGAGSFSSNISGLVANTKYYVRAYATNSAGTTYGNELSFSTSPVDIVSGLIGYWPFNGNANDESGNGNNGTVYGATLTADRNGNPNKAYSFNGIDNRIVCLKAGPTGNPRITINFWIKTNTLNYGHIFGYGNNALGGQDIRIFINGTTGNCNNNFIAFDTYNNLIAKTTTFSDTWDNYCITYDGSLGNNISVATLYKNGILMSNECAIINVSPTNISSNLPITFGRYHGTAPPSLGYFQGILDDIRFYNRVLTTAEISYLSTR